MRYWAGKLFVTDNGYDDRGSRPVWGPADVLWQVEQKSCYGWPDYSAGQPLTDKMFKPPWEKPLTSLLAKHPTKPPAPVARFGVKQARPALPDQDSGQDGVGSHAFLLGEQNQPGRTRPTRGLP